MNSAILLGTMLCIAYLLQAYLGFRQIKHFNKIYLEMRRKGKVAIGRRAGKIRAGRVVLLAIQDDGEIIDARRMQGTTVFAKIKAIQGFEGLYIQDLTMDHPAVQKENKYLRVTILDAVNVYHKVQTNEPIPEKATPFQSIGHYVKEGYHVIQKKWKRSA